MTSKIVFLTLLIVTLGQGYIQELQIHETSDPIFSTHHTFRNALHDLSTCYNVTAMICTKGFWIGYSDKEYEGTATELYGLTTDLNCAPAVGSGLRSLRHGGNINTTVREVTLYPEEGYQGAEQIVKWANPNGLLNAKSFVITGKDKWTVYSEQNFNAEGQVVCVTPDPNFDELEVFPVRDVTTTYSLPHIGSVMSGCITRDVELSKAYLAGLNKQ